MSGSRHFRIPVTTARSRHTNRGHEDRMGVCVKRAEVSIRWRGVVGLGFVLSPCFVSFGIALIGSHSPVSRSSSSSNYTSFFPFCFVWLRFSLLVLASSATDHRAHTPTTTPFHYVALKLLTAVTSDHLLGSIEPHSLYYSVGSNQLDLSPLPEP